MKFIPKPKRRVFRQASEIWICDFCGAWAIGKHPGWLSTGVSRWNTEWEVDKRGRFKGDARGAVWCPTHAFRQEHDDPMPGQPWLWSFLSYSPGTISFSVKTFNGASSAYKFVGVWFRTAIEPGFHGTSPNESVHSRMIKYLRTGKFLENEKTNAIHN